MILNLFMFQSVTRVFSILGLIQGCLPRPAKCRPYPTPWKLAKPAGQSWIQSIEIQNRNYKKGIQVSLLRTAPHRAFGFLFCLFLFCAPLPLSLNLCNVSRECFIKRRKAEVLSCSAWADPGVGEKPEQVERKPKVAGKDFFPQICRCGSLMFCWLVS